MSNLKVYAKTIEDEALEQINTLLSQDAFKDCKVRIMPDVHAGKGCVIGFTADLGNKVIPNIVGVDIGCGMLCVSLGHRDFNAVTLNTLDRVIRTYVPSGKNVHDGRQMRFEELALRMRFALGLEASLFNGFVTARPRVRFECASAGRRVGSRV